MVTPFIGEIRLMPYGFAPYGWYSCQGQILNIQQYPALAAVIGIQYGGDGKTTFGLPDLRGRAAVGYGNDPTDIFDPQIGTVNGANTVTLTSSNLPPHTHNLSGAQAPIATRSPTASGNLLSNMGYKPTSGNPVSCYPYATLPQSNLVTLSAATLSPFPGTGGAHENRQPYLALQWCIAWDGEFPVKS